MEELYPYYERELEFIRQMGAEFAQRYPKIAGRLQLEKDRCGDPHVERLIEAFALLAGRIQHKIDDEFPEVTESLLDLLYPHYLRPVPSMAIAQFEPDPSQSKPEIARIPAGTILHSRPAGGHVCTFRTAYPVELLPIRVSSASSVTLGHVGGGLPAETAFVIRLEIVTAGGIAFSKLPLSSLRFYLSGTPAVANALYELLLLDLIEVVIRDRRQPGASISLPSSVLRPVGLSSEEGLLPYSDRSFLGYRLLQEYFHFPEKFLFVDLSSLGAMAQGGYGSQVEILFCLRPPERPQQFARVEHGLTRDTFQLGCTPIVNLFRRPAETIRLTHSTYEYQVVPDQHRQRSTEIYSVDSVSSTATYLEESKSYYPFYSFQHEYQQTDRRHFWIAQRRPSNAAGDNGTEMYLSLVDLDFQPSLPPVEMLTVNVTCTNRDLPANLQWSGDWGELSPEGQGLSRVRLLRKPTPAVRPPLGRGLQWRLISHLSLNHLSIVEQGLEAFREILRLYDFSSAEDDTTGHRQINGIVGLSSRPAVSRVISDTGVTFCRGTEITVEFDEEQYAGAGFYLMASVLERFFGLYAAVNSFSRLVVRTRQRKGVLKQWTAIAGEQRVQ
jgi:type VI secretion system protein ImpG